MKQLSLFDGTQRYKLDKPLRLIELFAGYGSQSLALDYLSIPYESWRISEWAIPSIRAYKDLHHAEDSTDYSATVTDEYIAEWLSGRVSSNYNDPLSDEQIKRLGAKRRAEIYNAMMASHNLGSIVGIHGKDLALEDTDKYTYLMFYSFPCQDISTAGKGAGFAKCSGTRSGMLWEVERILDELNALDMGGQHLPQVLVAENVHALLAEKNRPDFNEWLRKLESLGYHNYYQTLNAKNYGIPQNRDRVFIVSILGDYYYDFPKPIELRHRLKDFLQKDIEENYYLRDEQVRMSTEDIERKIDEGCGVELLEPIALDEQNSAINTEGTVGTLTTDGSSPKHNNRVIEVYELSDKMKSHITQGNEKYSVSETSLVLNRSIACTKTTREGCTRADSSDYISFDFGDDKQLKVNQDLLPYRIRKLTERECWRLMGVKDEDFDKVAAGQSKSSMYHLAGDSIVATVLMAIFGELLGIDWQTKVHELVDEITNREETK